MADEQKAPVKPEIDPQKQARIDLENYDVRVRGMSHRQMEAELSGIANRKYNGKDFCMNPPKGMPLENRVGTGLDNALAVVLLTVLKNTMTAPVFEYKKNGDPKRFARKDQFGPGTISHYLR